MKSNTVDVNPNISVITLNTKGLNITIKDRDCLTDFFKMTQFYIYETHLNIRHI